MYSVKLKNITFSNPAIHTPTHSGIPHGQESTLSIKVKYRRDQEPTIDNPLNGLLNYVPIAKSVNQYLPQFDPITSVKDLEGHLLEELKQQNIHSGKFKFTIKPKTDPEKSTISDTSKLNEMSKVYRIRGSVNGVKIDHNHFLESQKSNKTGIHTENLSWVIKLKGENIKENSVQLKHAFDNAQFRDEVSKVVVNGLGLEKKALELVNNDIRNRVQEKIALLDIPVRKISLSLKRPKVLNELIPNQVKKEAVVVIGETHLMGSQRITESPPVPAQGEKLHSRSSRYQDFSF